MQGGLSVVSAGVATHDVIAVALARLGVAVEFVGRIGDDAVGATMRRRLGGNRRRA